VSGQALVLRVWQASTGCQALVRPEVTLYKKLAIAWFLDLVVFHSPKPSEKALRKSTLDCRLAASLSGERRAGEHDL
jgi:hypothetical protein